MLGNVNIKSRQAYFHTRFLVVLLPCIIKLYFCNVANALEIELYDKFRCFAAIGIPVTGKALRYSYTVQKLLVCGTLALNLSSSSLIVSSYLYAITIFRLFLRHKFSNYLCLLDPSLIIGSISELWNFLFLIQKYSLWF